MDEETIEYLEEDFSIEEIVEIKTVVVNEEDENLLNFFNIECVKCSPAVRFGSYTEYRVHFRTIHDEKRPFVTCCGKKLSQKSFLIDHMAYHLDPDKLKCPHCQRIYSDRKNLKGHVLQMHGSLAQKPFECHDCGKRFAKLEKLRVHVRVHLTKETKEALKEFVCDECGQTFRTNAVLKAHVKYKHLRLGNICADCGGHFKSKFDIQVHRRNVHGAAGPAREQCPQCHKWYSNVKALKIHIKAFHERKQVVNCEFCGKEMASKQSLYGHIRLKHKERSHHCDFCDKSFQTPIRLKEHRATHTGVSLYQCMYCPDKHFNVRANMYKHFKAIHPVEWQRDKVHRNEHPELYK